MNFQANNKKHLLGMISHQKLIWFHKPKNFLKICLLRILLVQIFRRQQNGFLSGAVARLLSRMYTPCVVLAGA